MITSKRMRLAIYLVPLLSTMVLFFGALSPRCSAQQTPPLQIISPATGTIVNPGQTIAVAVSSPSNTAFSQVDVVAQDPIGPTAAASAVPATFSLTIPGDIACRTYMLTAFGVTSSGQSLQSATILIDVERPDLPTAVSAQISGIALEVLGEQFPIVLLGTFSDGSILDVTESSNVTYSSSNTTVATADANGMVTGGSAGSATITATYMLNGQSVQTTIPVTVPPPVMSVSPVSLTFGGQNVGTTSSAQQITVTNTGTGPLRMLGVSTSGDFAETDNCTSSSPLAVNASCTVNVTFTPSAIGSRAGALSITNSFNVVPASISLTGTGIGQPTTTTSVTSSANPSVWGQSVTLTATVSPAAGGGTPTGTVTFSDGSNTLGTQTLTSGEATFTSSSLSVGSHSITATYSGDSTFQTSTGTLTQTVNVASTTVGIASSANPSVLNSSVTLTASVSAMAPGAGTPTGTIVFKDGSTVLSTVTISSSGQATFSTSSLVAGPHSITASYSGDSNFSGNISSTLSQSVQYEPVGGACDGAAGHQILQPIDPGGTSVFKQGQTIPAKFRVCDANGVSIGSAGVVSSFLLTQTVSGTATTNVEDIVDTNNPDTAFRWDSTDQQWIFNISTQNLAANSTYIYTITLNDGTTITFQYGLR